jgi:hypothetical protein
VNEYTQIAGHIRTAGTAISKSISDHSALRHAHMPLPPRDDDDREMTADDLLDVLQEAPLDEEEFHRLEARIVLESPRRRQWRNWTPGGTS